MKNLTLRKKFIFLFLAIFFIPFGILTFFSLSMSEGMIEQNTILHLQNLVEIKETAVEQWLLERIRDGKALTESEEIRSLNPKKIEPFLNFTKGLHQAYRELLVVDLKGKVIAPLPSQEGIEREEWFQKALEKELYISPPVLRSTSVPPIFIISFLIKDREGRPAGVLKALVEMDYIARLLFESHFGETGKLFLANLRGEILLHERLSELTARGLSRVPYFEKFLFKPTYTAVYTDPQGNEVLGSWK